MKMKKDVFYFKTYETAHEYAVRNNWPTNRIISYDMGWAIQLYVSGPYVGPGAIAARMAAA